MFAVFLGHMKKKRLTYIPMMCATIFLVLVIGTGFVLYQTTGFLQTEKIDFVDEKNWDLANGLIPGSQAIEFHGASAKCWVLVHGYTSTPDELRELAIKLYLQFNDSVFVPRLYGHGERPSHLEQYSVDYWYAQVEKVVQENNCTYLVGSSMGASIVLRYAELHDTEGIVLLGATFRPQPDYLPVITATKVIYPLVRYTKKDEPGVTVLDPQGGVITGGIKYTPASYSRISHKTYQNLETKHHFQIKFTSNIELVNDNNILSIQIRLYPVSFPSKNYQTKYDKNKVKTFISYCQLKSELGK